MSARIVNIFFLFNLALFQSPDTLKVIKPPKILPPRPAKTLNEVIPQIIIDRMMQADIVECYLLCERWRQKCDSLKADHLIEPYTIRKQGDDLSGEDIQLLMSILTNPNSYMVFSPGDGKLCGCTAHMAYNFARLGTVIKQYERVVVIICHDCSYIIIKNRGTRIGLDMDYAADEFLDLTRKLFPDDSLTIDVYIREYGSSDKLPE